uniref:Uncharacterized protein n=1 Tax=Cacopsylla melanoneura TaxID=428564 RepID=A0A8D8RMM2_9HEMI
MWEPPVSQRASTTLALTVDYVNQTKIITVATAVSVTSSCTRENIVKLKSSSRVPCRGGVTQPAAHATAPWNAATIQTATRAQVSAPALPTITSPTVVRIVSSVIATPLGLMMDNVTRRLASAGAEQGSLGAGVIHVLISTPK